MGIAGDGSALIDELIEVSVNCDEAAFLLEREWGQSTSRPPSLRHTKCRLSLGKRSGRWMYRSEYLPVRNVAHLPEAFPEPMRQRLWIVYHLRLVERLRSAIYSNI